MGEGVLQQRHKLWRREIRLDRAKHEIEEGAGNRARDGYASRVVDGEVVALEPRRDPPRQYAIRCDEGRGLAGRFDAGLEDQRDGFSLVMCGRRDDHAKARESIGEARAALWHEAIRLEKALPKLCALGRTQRFAHEMQPRAGTRIRLASRHIGHVLVLHAELAYQL